MENIDFLANWKPYEYLKTDYGILLEMKCDF